MSKNIFRTKSINQFLSETKQDGGMNRVLGTFGLTMLGIGCIVGTGIFVLTGIAAANYSGPALVISFIIAALACGCAALCYSEFAAMIPVAGSAYTYGYVALGEFWAWVIGWDLILEYALGAATVSVSWSRYLIEFLIKHDLNFIPHQLLCSPFETLSLSNGMVINDGIINLPAIFIVSLLSFVLINGTRQSAVMNNFLVFLKLCVVFVFIIVGWKYILPANHDPYIVPNAGEVALNSGQIGFWSFLQSDNFGHYGISGILRGAAVVFFSFVGFDAVSTAAQEAKNPKRDMPIGILGSLLVCTILYVLFS